MRKFNKAQIKMFESVAVLVVFFFFLVFGAGFWFVLSKASAEKDLDRVITLQALQIAQRAAFMPELDCSFVGVQKENCFDIRKAEQFAAIINDPRARTLYFSNFGTSTIKLNETYPNPREVATVYNNKITSYTDRVTIQNPVLLYDPGSTKYSFGVLEVTLYAER